MKRNVSGIQYAEVALRTTVKDKVPKVSIIIPVYNEERYLKECLDSVVGQTLRETEIICVDDGSTDQSPEILREYARSDARMRVITQENAGLSAARNAGMEQATGQYLYFLDSDDRMDRRALERMYDRASGEGLEILGGNAHPFLSDYEVEERYAHYVKYYHRKNDYPDLYSGAELFCAMADAGDYKPTVSMWFFDRRYLEEAKIRFVPGILHEDGPFTFQALLTAQRVGYERMGFYERRVVSGSIMTKPHRWENVYGYFIGALEMKRFLLSGVDLDEAAASAAGKYIDRTMLANARRIYGKLEPDEQRKAEGLSGEQQLLFHALVHEYEEQRSRYANELRKSQEEIRRQTDRVKHLQSSMTAVQGCLEEAERTRMRLEESLSYRMGRIITWMPRKIRRLCRK